MEQHEETFEEAFAEATSGAPAEESKDTVEAAPASVDESTSPEPKDTAAPPSEAKDAPAAEPEKPAEPDYRAMFEAEQQARKSLEGRVNAQKAEYNQRLAEMEQARAKPAAPSFEPDEVEKEEIEEFRKKHPDIAKATIDGAKGGAWQKLLVNRGEDELLTLYEVNSSVADERTAEIREDLGRRATRDHYATIETAHPDWMQLVANPAPKSADDVFNPEFAGFVMGLPYSEGQLAVQIIKEGKPDQVIALISAFKNWRSKRPASPSKSQPQDPRRVASAAPVRGRSAGTPPAAADPNDFGAAWNEATGARR
jgi:hypothetical protein